MKNVLSAISIFATMLMLGAATSAVLDWLFPGLVGMKKEATYWVIVVPIGLLIMYLTRGEREKK